MTKPAIDFTSPAEVKEKLREAVKDAFEPKRKLNTYKERDFNNGKVVFKNYSDGEEVVILKLEEPNSIIPQLLVFKPTDHNFKQLKEYATR